VKDRRHVERFFIMEGVVELQRLRRVVRPKLLDRSDGMGLGKLHLCLRSRNFAGRYQLADAVGGGKRGGVGRLNDDLQVGIDGLDIIQRERVHAALIGNQVEVGMDAIFSGMQEAVVADRIDDPEVFVPGSDLHDLLSGGELDEGGVAHLGADTDNIVDVVFHYSGSLLTVSYGRREAEQKRNDGCSRAHENLL
jgi:hypothetical protein